MRLNTKKRRDWCDTCAGYTYHGFGVGCLVCTQIESAVSLGGTPPASRPAQITIKSTNWLNGGHAELEIHHEPDDGPARVVGLLVPKGRLLYTIHSFKPCFVYVNGNRYLLRGE